MNLFKSSLRHFIVEVLKESNEGDVGADLIPPEVPFVKRAVKPEFVEDLKAIQNELGIPATGVYDYKTEKAWDNFTNRSGILTDEDIVGATREEIATSWEKFAPRIVTLFDKQKSYSPDLKGMRQFILDVKNWEVDSLPVPIPDVSYEDTHAGVLVPLPEIDDLSYTQNLAPAPVEKKKSSRKLFDVEPGKKLEHQLNFDLLRDGKNNYRAGLSENHIDVSPETFEDLNRRYGIKTVITLNSDYGGDKIPGYVRAAGLKSICIPIGAYLGTTDFERVKAALRSGNTLIHCAHGADRTGGAVARYYVDENIMNVDAAYDDMLLHKSGSPKKSVARFAKEGPWQSSNH